MTNIPSTQKSETEVAEGGGSNEVGDPMSPDGVKKEKLNRRRSTWSEAEKQALVSYNMYFFYYYDRVAD